MTNTRELELWRLVNNAFQNSIEKFGDIFAKDVTRELLANGVTVQEWIPVTERLPDKAGDYLIYATVPFNGRKFIAAMHYDKDEYCPIWQDTTHWMPLPQPPKGE